MSAKRRAAHRMVVIKQRRARLWKKIVRAQAEILWHVLKSEPPQLAALPGVTYQGRPIVVDL